MVARGLLSLALVLALSIFGTELRAQCGGGGGGGGAASSATTTTGTALSNATSLASSVGTPLYTSMMPTVGSMAMAQRQIVLNEQSASYRYQAMVTAARRAKIAAEKNSESMQSLKQKDRYIAYSGRK